MHIRQYQMHDTIHSLSLPKGAKFLSARKGPHWSVLFFLHQDDWTEMEPWYLVAVRTDSSPAAVMGGDISQYEFLYHMPPIDGYADYFLFRKTG